MEKSHGISYGISYGKKKTRFQKVFLKIRILKF